MTAIANDRPPVIDDPPGSSQSQVNGVIRSRSHPAFQWLAANAERFGFYNLPSEPWHWSTTGS